MRLKFKSNFQVSYKDFMFPRIVTPPTTSGMCVGGVVLFWSFFLKIHLHAENVGENVIKIVKKKVANKYNDSIFKKPSLKLLHKESSKREFSVKKNYFK